VILGPQGPLARVPLLDLSERVDRGPVTIRLTEVMGPEPYRPSETRATRALWVLRGVAAAYRAVLPAAAWFALALYGISFLHMIWTRRIGILVFANTVLLTAMASRLALLSYVDVAAFPAISTGVYRFPGELAAEIATRTVAIFLKQSEPPKKVIFCCFGADSLKHHQIALANL